MSDLKNTITAGNSAIWSQSDLPLYPNGDDLKFGPSLSTIYNTVTYPLVHSFTSGNKTTDEHKITSAEGGQFLWQYTKVVDDYAKKLRADVYNTSTGMVPRAFTINGHNFASKTSFSITKANVGLGNVPNYTFATSGNSNTVFASTSYVNTKARWITSTNGRPTGQVVDYARRLEHPVNVQLTGAVTGLVSNWEGNNSNIVIATSASPKLTLSGDATGSATFTNLANATLSVTVVNDSHTHDGRYFTESESNSRFAYKAGSSGQAFSASTFTGALTGNASSATKWNTARTLTTTLTGNISGSSSMSVDGTGNKTVTVSTVVKNSSGDFTIDSGKLHLSTSSHIQYNSTTKSIDFIF